jgi:branched-chain amino acid aminotransferase
MVVFLNGQWVPESQAMVSVFDRSFLYGDGLFETLRVVRGKTFRWSPHLERLQRGAAFLGIPLPFPPESLRGYAEELIARNGMPEALLRLTLSRGVGVRGYSPAGAVHPILVMTLHPAPAHALGRADLPVGLDAQQRVPALSWKLVTASCRLPAGEPLARFKTCNKLPQILARAEADTAGADEALLLNTDGFVVEAASSNLFWIDGATVCTAPLLSGILAGVTREVVQEFCRAAGIPTREINTTSDGLLRQDGVFLSLSSWGVVEAESLDGRPLKRSPLTGQICRAYEQLVQAETA